MENITLPPPEEIRHRIADCELELKSLRRLFRMVQALQDAAKARERRSSPTQGREAPDVC
jgi:hypothetical protein